MKVQRAARNHGCAEQGTKATKKPIKIIYFQYFNKEKVPADWIWFVANNPGLRLPQHLQAKTSCANRAALRTCFRGFATFFGAHGFEQIDRAEGQHGSWGLRSVFRLRAQGWIGLCGIFGPGVPGILPAHILAHVAIGCGPEARQVGCHLHGSARR